jgi:hypothetical protein
MTVGEGVAMIAVPLVGAVTVPASVVAGLGTLGALGINQTIGGLVAGTSGTVAAIDLLITLEAGTWAVIRPVEDREKWGELVCGYLANTMSDVATLTSSWRARRLDVIPSGLIAEAIDSLTAMLKYAQVPRKLMTIALKAF